MTDLITNLNEIGEENNNFIHGLERDIFLTRKNKNKKNIFNIKKISNRNLIKNTKVYDIFKTTWAINK